MKIIFMGTPDFAAAALEALLKAGHEIVLAVTQPDKPKGRSGQLQQPPVKACALAHNIPVFQPERIKRPEAVAVLKEYEAEVFVVAAFGQILSQEILDMPKRGCLNIHASLLPKYRGASPIQHVILDGEEKTGITIMQMNAGLDTGDILYQRETVIKDTDTYQSLEQSLMELGGQAIVEALELMEKGELVPTPQDDEKSCYAALIRKEMGRLDFMKDAVVLDRQIRGMNPWPSAFTFLRGKQLKIWSARPESENVKGADPGQVVSVEKDCFKICTGNGTLAVYEVQLEGKKRMNSHDFLLGVQLKPGEFLGA